MSTAFRFRRAYDVLLADLGRLFRIPSCVLAILLALALTLQPATPARAECGDVGDMAAAMVQAAKTAGICMNVCSEGNQYSCYAAAGLAIFLVELRKNEGQDKVNLFCDSISSALGAVTDKVALIQQIMELLQSMGVDTSNYSDTLSGAAQDIATVIAIVNCACETEDLQIKNQESFGDCLNQLAEKLGCGSIDWSTGTLPDCDPIGAIAGEGLNWGEHQLHKACCKLEIPFCTCDGDHAPGFRNSFCEPGYQSDAAGNCLTCDKTNIQHVVTLGNGRCGCDSLYTPTYHVLCLNADCTNTQKILDSCVCTPPREEKNDRCLCPEHQKGSGDGCVPCTAYEKYIPYTVDAKGIEHLPSCGQCPLPDIPSEDGTECIFPYNCDPKAGQVPVPSQPWHCKTCGDHQRAADNDLLYKYRCEDCKTGEKVSTDHLKCEPACDGSKNEYFEIKSGSCKICADYQRVAYSGGERGAVGICINCDTGQKGSSDQSQCVPKCGPGEVVAPPDNTVKPSTAPLASGALPGPTDQTAPGPATPNATLTPSTAPLAGDAKSAQGPATISDPDPGKVAVNEALLASLCRTCPENTYARHDKEDSSVGTCEPCAAGTHSYAGAVECIPLNCGASGYQDPDNPNACKYCPPSQIYVAGEKKIVPGPGGQTRTVFVSGHCGCGPNQRLEGDVCVCAAGTIAVTQPGTAGPPIPAGCACPTGASLDAATFSCKCPSGAKLDASGRNCVCGVGARLDNGKCVPPSLTKVPLKRKDCSAAGAAFINDPNNAARCIRCTGGRVANSDRTACVAKPSTTIMTPKGQENGRGKPRRGDTWLNPQPEPPKPARNCPPHMTPNLRGTGCVPRLDTDFGAPGSHPAGVGTPATPTFRRH